MEKWSFYESHLWGNNYPKCNLNNQSPINIDTELVKECKTLCEYELSYKNSKCFINNKNNLVKIKCSQGSYFIYQNTPFELSEITIHTPSLHTIDGVKSDVEICFIHTLGEKNSEINKIILSRLFDKGPNYGNAETFINQIINDIPLEEIQYDKEIKVSPKWGPDMLIPESNKSYFTYNGSLHYPPCTDKVKWFIYEDIGTIGYTNIETLKTFIGNNTRPIKSTNNRPVFYVPVSKERKKNKRVVYSSDNKYLKCIKQKEFKENNSTKPTITEYVDNSAINNSILLRIKQILLSLTIIIILINSYYFVNYLYKHFYWQKLLRIIVGNNIINAGVYEDWVRCQKT